MQIPYMCSKMISVYDPLNPPEPEPDPNRTYTWTFFARGNHDMRFSYSVQTFFQSRYPAYIYPVEVEGEHYFYLCTFMKGEYPVRMTCYHDVHYEGDDPNVVKYTYLRQASVLSAENVDVCTPAIWGCEYPSGEVVPLRTTDPNVLESVSSYSDPFYHYTFGAGEAFKQNSSWHEPSVSNRYRIWQPKIAGDKVFAVTLLVDADYRFINNPTFQSGEAWLEWCKNH